MLSQTQADKMLAEVNDLYTDAVDHFRTKRSGLRKVVQNAAYFRGLQHLLRGSTISTEQGERAITCNITRHIINKATADTLRNMPDPRIAAAKDDQKARNRARMTQRMCKAFVRNGVIDQEELHKLVSWMKQTGAGWAKITWDPHAGKPLPAQQTGFEKFESVSGVEINNDSEADLAESETEAEEQDVGSEMLSLESLEGQVDDGFGALIMPTTYTGEICFEFVSQCDGFPNPDARARKELSHFFHRKLRPVRELERRYKKDIFGKTTKQRFHTGTASPERSAFRAISEEDSETAWTNSHKTEAAGNVLAELVEFWEVPTDEFPAGRLIIFSGNMILYMGRCIYEPARIPFVLFNGDNINSNALYADGISTDIEHYQRAANFNETKLFEQLDQIVNFHILAPLGSGITKNTWGNKSGQVIGYARGMKPEPWVPQNLNSTQFEYTDRQIERAMSTSGYDRALQDLPSNTSGRTYAFAEQASQRMREPDQASFRRSMYETFQHCIWLGKQFYDQGRMITLVGENAEFELHDFNDESFDMDSDIVMDVFGEGNKTEASKVDEVLAFADSGILDDGPRGERSRKLLSDEYAYRMHYDPHEIHRQRARRENTMILNFDSRPIIIKTNDNHRCHLDEHDKLELSQEFDELPEWQQQKLIAHRLLHEEYLSAQLATGVPGDFQPSMGGPPQPGAPQQLGAGQPQPGGAPAAQEGSTAPSSAPTTAEFSQMSDTQRRAADQQ